MRLIAERLLPPAMAGTTYVDKELASQKVGQLALPKDGHAFHVYCSTNNPGADALMAELVRVRGFAGGGDSGVSRDVLLFTTDPTEVRSCDHMLLYLTAQTWTRGAESEALAAEVAQAMSANVHILLAHEMVGVGGQEARFACEFGSFFSHPDGATPEVLLHGGIYSEIAVRSARAAAALPRSMTPGAAC